MHTTHTSTHRLMSASMPIQLHQRLMSSAVWSALRCPPNAPTCAVEKTHDFLVDLGEKKPDGQVLIGFAAETDDLIDNAMGKLARKKLDLIVANDVSKPGVGFEHDTNEVVVLGADGTRIDIPLTDKRNVARRVLDTAAIKLA